MLGDERTDQRRRGSLSRAKKLVAALRISIVCSSSALRRFNARISAAEVSAPTGKPLPGHEAKRLLAALERTAGNVREAAKLLGISRGGFYVKLKKLGLNPDEYR